MKNLSRKNFYLLVIGLVVMVMCAACASTGDKAEKPAPAPGPPAPTTPEPPPPPPPPPPAAAPSKPSPDTQYFVHTVKFKGESVSIIAGWYTGDIQNWKILAEHNPDINPNRIFEGNKIRIPEYMMKNRAPMPKDYVDGFYTKPSKKEPGRPASPPAPGKEDELIIFGPKESPGK
jgi:hypothetical protein